MQQSSDSLGCAFPGLILRGYCPHSWFPKPLSFATKACRNATDVLSKVLWMAFCQTYLSKQWKRSSANGRYPRYATQKLENACQAVAGIGQTIVEGRGCEGTFPNTRLPPCALIFDVSPLGGILMRPLILGLRSISPSWHIRPISGTRYLFECLS